jgi:N-acetylglucosamine-6-phosphate deacetylase
MRLPDPDLICDWSPERGVLLVTLAPELPRAAEMIVTLSDRRVVVSAGHSMATSEQAWQAFRAGVSYATHLFNAMPPFHHREPGLVGAALADLQVTAGIIVDGIHVHPEAVMLAFRLKGPRGLNLVTDAMAALGMPPGKYLLGDREVTSDGKSVRNEEGALAGSVLSLDEAVRNLVAFTDCSPGEAISTVTVTPASVLGIAHRRGRIEPGCIADLVLLTPGLQVAGTIIEGAVGSHYHER